MDLAPLQPALIGSQPEHSAAQLLLGDCLNLLGGLPDNSVDCILTDPPYGYDYLSRSKKLPKVRIANDGHCAIPLLRRALQLVYPKLKADGVGLVFTNWQCFTAMAAAVEEAGYVTTNTLIWVKNAWTRGDMRGNWGYKYEFILFFRKKNLPTKLRRFLNGQREGNVLVYPRVPTQSMRHPTEKPVALLKYLIEKVTQPGETVLDMFAGVGSTGVAAQQAGRRPILIELERVWCDVAMSRLQGALA
ncbi:MAG: site-specific DNA-methyltransferase [Chloroflexota bacterium]|nr:site-specific DNA-methyltransferase [Chloroflexota bacterium]